MTQDHHDLNALELAEKQLRDICDNGLSPPADASALGRILTHLTNIRRSLNESDRDQANAAKRLVDFANAVLRMAKRVVPDESDVVARMTKLADSLRTAGIELARSGTPPADTHAAA